MELSAIWYFSAILANAVVIGLLVYIAVLATAYYIERCLSLRESRRKEFHHRRAGR